MTKTGVYALDDDLQGRRVNLIYLPWDGGERRKVLTTTKLEGYIKTWSPLSGHVRKIESFTLRPGWDGGAQ